MATRRIDVYSKLLADITSWELPPGSPLREEELAAHLGVSRTPVREALARLRSDGLVEQRSGQIARVSPVGLDDTVAVYQARDALETYAVQLAARSSQRSLFAPLASGYDRFAEQAPRTDELTDRLYALSDEFDQALLRAVPNGYLLGPLQATRAALLRLRRLSSFAPSRLTVAARQRADECRAIAAGDAESAGRLSHERIQSSLHHVISALLDGQTARVLPSTLREEHL
ncbi:GntR family transcriptional regulator [Actinokineospora sp. PR83]|uniref:GntR family transcriptional regulator n=1 Tax=Actinokineospora sp. PR83 TaxID=2884908 RepID=UPI001F20EFDA|nr:GntR family transcriptional regulator [Actinokineospora sp. PR83]MCG8917171.1 GntR family transcriptional regulator [Actinokineospora sp. PR83]